MPWIATDLRCIQQPHKKKPMSESHFIHKQNISSHTLSKTWLRFYKHIQNVVIISLYLETLRIIQHKNEILVARITESHFN